MDQTFERELDLHDTTASGAQTMSSVTATSAATCNSPRGIFSECPHCGSGLYAEHAHFRCGSCGWRDSCCD
ncbi:MAG: hypothetical protein WCI32_03070 [Actinomycetota bacterium]